MDLDDFSIPGLIFAVIAFGIGILVANSMKGGLLLKILSGVICGVAGYFVGGKIAES